MWKISSWLVLSTSRFSSFSIHQNLLGVGGTLKKQTLEEKKNPTKNCESVNLGWSGRQAYKSSTSFSGFSDARMCRFSFRRNSNIPLNTNNTKWSLANQWRKKFFFFLRIHLLVSPTIHVGLPWWFTGKESAGQWGDTGSVPGSGRSHGAGNRNPLQYSPLGNPMDRGAWLATVHAVAKSHIQISNWACTHITVTCSWWFSTLVTIQNHWKPR